MPTGCARSRSSTSAITRPAADMRLPQKVGPPRLRRGRSATASPGPAIPPGSIGPLRRPSHNPGRCEESPDQLRDEKFVTENPAPGSSTKHRRVPPVQAPRSTPAAPSASTAISYAEMNEQESYFTNNSMTPDAPDPTKPEAQGGGQARAKAGQGQNEMETEGERV